jgi:exodeoxyribonuclease V alpha subunit
MAHLQKNNTWQEFRTILSETSLFSSLDIHFANFIARLSETDSIYVPLAAALVSQKTGEGDVCLNLREYSDKRLQGEPEDRSGSYLTCPSFGEWVDLLLQSAVVGQGTGNTPLVFDRDDRLYLRRYWEYEQCISNFIRHRTASFAPDIEYGSLASDFRKLSRTDSPEKSNWQNIAAIMAVTNLFTVVSGGPGTGKTSTVAKMIVLLNSQFGDRNNLRIALGAPTGKAASRLQEAIISTGLLPGSMEFPSATTLHRMLGTIPHSPYFRHNSENPLDADVIIIDEASMVDLPLMAKLMQAIPPSARLILLGDRHQLASVQPGAVLGDICPPGNMNCFSEAFEKQIKKICGGNMPKAAGSKTQKSPDMQDSFVELVDNYRFSDDSSIAKLSTAIKKGDGDAALDILLSDETGQISWSDVPPTGELVERLYGWKGFPQYDSLMHTQDPDKCFAVLDKYRILCGLRRGPYGMQRVNGVLTQLLAGRPVSSRKHPQLQQDLVPFLAGQPVMVTRNDYSQQLYNGDVGIILPELETDETLRAFFKEESGTLKKIGLALLPEHETVYAMTVHKSQGSEFDRVLLILPDQDAPLLTRELLYTAITRAREHLEIWGRKNIFRQAVKRQIARKSGLKEALWGDND